MNKIGIYYAYWTREWDVDFVPFVEKVAGMGFDILEVNSGTVMNMSNAERDRLRNAAEEHKIDLTFCIGLAKRYDIAAEDSDTRRHGIEFLRNSAEMVKYMGAKQLGGIIYSSWPGRLPDSVFDKRPFVDRSVECMKVVIKTAEDCGVFFNVEVVNRFEQYMLNTAAEAVNYCERVGSDHCRIMLDAFHMNIEEDSIRDAIITAGKRLGHFHIGETNRKAPGRGRMPWEEIVGALREIGYDGAVVMEPFLQSGGEVGRVIRVFRDLDSGIDLDQEAKRALEFIRSKL
jgi:D-psicose/D-tagatose/L-ribulose 3-epimerase